MDLLQLPLERADPGTLQAHTPLASAGSRRTQELGGRAGREPPGAGRTSRGLREPGRGRDDHRNRQEESKKMRVEEGKTVIRLKTNNIQTLLNIF